MSCSARTQALGQQPMLGLQEGDVSVCTASGGKSVAVGCEWRSTVVSRHRKQRQQVSLTGGHDVM